MGHLSTHVLDTSIGRPAAGVRIDLFRSADDAWTLLKSLVTNSGGRTDKPLLEAAQFTAGNNRIEFHIGIPDASLHYHVPLLCTPWSYTTYRGS
jgi:5-hydroxyisourate hydrolase